MENSIEPNMSGGSNGTDAGSNSGGTAGRPRRQSYLDNLIKQQSQALEALSDDFESQLGSQQIQSIEEESEAVALTDSSASLPTAPAAAGAGAAAAVSPRHRPPGVHPQWVKRVSVTVNKSKLVEGT